MAKGRDEMGGTSSKRIGAHVSTEGGVENAPLNAGAIGAKAFALFVKPQRQWLAPPLKDGVAEAFTANCRQVGIAAADILPHASYLVNLATPDEDARAKAIDSLAGEMARCAALGLSMLNVHPGSFLKTGTPKEGCERVADSINRACDKAPGVRVVVENTAGQGSYLGSTFEEIAWILEGVKDEAPVGVCLDTAHLYGAGFDIATDEGYAATMARFAELVGFDQLKAMHLNDTKVATGSHVDRHASIGDGVLGVATFARVMHDKRLDGMPLILETPDPDKWAQEISDLYAL